MRVLAGLGSLVLLSGIATPATAHVRVVATLPDLCAIAAAVGGSEVEVECLASASEDPHYVDPRPSYVVSLSSADLLVANGLELEIGWLPPLQQNARNSEVMVGGRGYMDASQYVSPQDVPTGPVDRSMGDVHPGGNPHFTLSPTEGARVARAMGERLSELDPEHASQFRAGAESVGQELEAFAAEQTLRFQALPNRRIIAYHASLTYLCRWLGLEQVETIEPRPGIAPSPGHVADVLAVMRAQDVSIILQEAFYPTRTSEQLASLGEAELVVLPGGTDFDSGESYLAHLRSVADAIWAALERAQ